MRFNSNRLALGAAQIGFDYGVSNSTGIIPKAEVSNILRLARNYEIDTIDTAVSYGESEKNLGDVGVKEFMVISKLPKYLSHSNKEGVKEWVDSNIIESLTRLEINSLHGILLHRAEDLLGENGDQIFNCLMELKNIGLIKKIGVSIYDFQFLDLILEKYKLDIVQTPFNLIDQRLTQTGWLSHLKEKKIEVHVRSIFLQGLLLMEENKRPAYFKKWTNLWITLEKIKKESGKSALELCLDFINQFSMVDKIIVGVQSCENLDQIISIVNKSSLSIVSDQISSNDIQLINPSLWNI